MKLKCNNKLPSESYSHRAYEKTKVVSLVTTTSSDNNRGGLSKASSG